MSAPQRPESSELAAIYRRNAKVAWNALGRAGIVREAERCELLQDVFVIAHQKLATRDRRVPEAAWISAIAKFVARDYRALKRTQEEQPMADPDAHAELAATGPSPEELTAQRRDYLALIGALSFEDRAVFEMHDVEGFDVPEIARALTMPEGTARTRLRRARQDLTAAASRLRAREAHAAARTGLPILLPFGLGAWGASARAFDEAPAGLEDALWSGVCRAVARHGAGSAMVARASLSVASAFTGGVLIGGGTVGALVLAARVFLGPAPVSVVRADDPPLLASAAASSADEPPAPPSASAGAGPVPAATVAPIPSSHAAPPSGVGLDPEEMRLYQQALAASRSGDFDAASGALDQHARRFPRGALATDRERLRAKIAAARRATPAPSSVDAGAPRRLFGTDD